jgi:hypothetical protein
VQENKKKRNIKQAHQKDAAVNNKISQRPELEMLRKKK